MPGTVLCVGNLTRNKASFLTSKNHSLGDTDMKEEKKACEQLR